LRIPVCAVPVFAPAPPTVGLPFLLVPWSTEATMKERSNSAVDVDIA